MKKMGSTLFFYDSFSPHPLGESGRGEGGGVSSESLTGVKLSFHTPNICRSVALQGDEKLVDKLIVLW